MSLKKGATFHSPTTPPTEDFDPILSIPNLPRRSPTCPKAILEQHVAIAAGEKRMAEHLADLLGSFEPFSGHSSGSSDSQTTIKAEDFPVPRGILEANIITDPTLGVDPRASESKSAGTGLDSPPAARHHRHTSDSGLGSSVSSTMMSSPEMGRAKEHGAASRQRSKRSPIVLNNTSAVTRSISSVSGTESPSHALSPRAFQQIEKHIIIPLLRAQHLKDFHPLVKGVPNLVENKEITCLRDLEKTLLYLAPRFALTKALYLRFCETSIQCVHTAVEYLNERDQRRPSDPRYTNGYFLDLVAQIRQYAATMAASRARQQAGEEPDEWDYSPDETVTLEGGLGRTGRPAEIVRRKNDKALSLRTGEPYTEETSPTMKRALSEDSSDDSVLRSMARRKKNAPIKDTTKTCDVCHKTFTRPCDLTKHEKTHSRPWKCPDASCTYHTKGWPTQKECERHVNDKHSKDPVMYACQYQGCKYLAKRESNCKQHMEKAHGYVYVRSKKNGKHDTNPSVSGQPTPQTPNLRTPMSSTVDYRTPVSANTAASASPFDGQAFNGYQTPYSGGASTSVAGSGDFALYPEENDQFAMPDMATDEDMGLDLVGDLDFNAFEAELASSDPSTYTALPSTFNAGADNHFTSPTFNPDMSHDVTSNFDWNMDADYTAFPAQLATPAHSLQSHSRNPSISLVSPIIPNLSPNAQANAMLYGSNNKYNLPADDGFAEFASNSGPARDFPLYETSNTAGNMHSSISSLNTRTDQMYPALNGQFAAGEDAMNWASQNITMFNDDYMNFDNSMAQH